MDDLPTVVDFALVDEKREPVHEPEAHTDHCQVGGLELPPVAGVLEQAGLELLLRGLQKR